MEYRHIIELRLCESPCQGQSCCDCCGKAPAIHLAGGGLLSVPTLGRRKLLPSKPREKAG